VKKFILEDFNCKYCGASDVVRYGTEKGTQYWLCNKCGHKFADNRASPEMKTPPQQIASAVNMYYEGMSLNAIRRHLDQQYKNCPSNSTVYEWIDRYTSEAVKKTREYKPKVGDVWVADETVLKIGGKNYWFWDLIDVKTRFLLATHMSSTRTTQHAKALVEKASMRAGKIPKVIITDKLYAYLDGIELAFGADTKHITSKGFSVQPNTNLIERFHGTLKDRTKVMRGLKKPETALSIMDGWLVHYNFFRPHEALGYRTPAERANIQLPFKNWADVIGVPKVAVIRKTKPLLIYDYPRISYKVPRITPRLPHKEGKPEYPEPEKLLYLGLG
jgi:putative transposase